jgi:DNA-binding IclR family transcriptional regulator
LEAVRRTGLARSTQEHRRGVLSLAVPVFDHSGIAAALALIAPLASPRLSDALPALRRAAAAISHSITRYEFADGNPVATVAIEGR